MYTPLSCMSPIAMCICTSPAGVGWLCTDSTGLTGICTVKELSGALYSCQLVIVGADFPNFHRMPMPKASVTARVSKTHKPALVELFLETFGSGAIGVGR